MAAGDVAERAGVEPEGVEPRERDLGAGRAVGRRRGVAELQPRRHQPSFVRSETPSSGAADEPWARPVARVAIEGVQRVEDGEHARRTQRVAPFQRPLGVGEPQPHRGVDVVGRGDAPLSDVAADIDDGRHHALGDEAGRIVDHRHRRPVAREQRVYLVAEVGVGDRRGHQGAAPVEPEQRVDGDRPLRLHPGGEGRRRAILAQRREQAEAPRIRPRARVDGARIADDFGEGLAPRVVHRAEPDPLRQAGRRRRRGRDDLLAVGVFVEADSGLAAVQPGGDALARLGQGAEARLVVELAVDLLHHRMAHVEPDDVEQLERAEGEARRLAQYVVHVGVGADALGDDAQPLGAQPAAGMVDQEARRVLGAHRGVAEPPRQGHERVRRRRGGAQARHHLDHAQHRDRVEEMEPGHALGRGAGSGDGRHRQRRGVGGEDAVRPHHLFQRGEQLALRLQLLDHDLDHQVAIGQRGERGGGDEPSLGGLARRRLQALALDRAVDHPAGEGDGVGNRAVAQIMEPHLAPALGDHLGDAAPHRARADDADHGGGSGEISDHATILPRRAPSPRSASRARRARSRRTASGTPRRRTGATTPLPRRTGP